MHLLSLHEQYVSMKSHNEVSCLEGAFVIPRALTDSESQAAFLPRHGNGWCLSTGAKYITALYYPGNSKH